MMMRGKTMLAVAVLSASCAMLIRPTDAETLVENSAEVRLQLDFQVADASIKKALPAGWETDVATSGGAKDCNLRMIFVDRVDITGPDGAAKATSQFVYLEVPVKNPAAGLGGRMVIDGLTVNPKDAPGPFKVYQAAASYRMDRTTSAKSGQPAEITEDWDFTGADGKHMALHLKYERGVARKGGSDLKLFSGADPNVYQIVKISQGLDPMRNVTVPSRDLVKEFSYQVSGAELGSLFDGKERVISIDSIQWHNRAVSLP
jgi:hypothetical protein